MARIITARLVDQTIMDKERFDQLNGGLVSILKEHRAYELGSDSKEQLPGKYWEGGSQGGPGQGRGEFDATYELPLPSPGRVDFNSFYNNEGDVHSGSYGRLRFAKVVITGDPSLWSPESPFAEKIVSYLTNNGFNINANNVADAEGTVSLLSRSDSRAKPEQASQA